MSAPGTEQDATRCTPCRGTGRIVSNLGGDAHAVACPWCGGTGTWDPGRDAQAAPAETADPAPAEGAAGRPA